MPDTHKLLAVSGTIHFLAFETAAYSMNKEKPG